MNPPRRRSPSATLYQLEKQDENAIIRTTGYYRRCYGLSVIYISSREHAPVRASILTSSLQPSKSLGDLDRLPLELLFQTMLHLDMQTIFNLRQVNVRARQVVDSLRPYQAAISHGLRTLCALLRTKLAAYVSLLDFYRVLCTKYCTFCGRFGGFVFLPTWIRCCFECIGEDPETSMVTVTEARRLFGLARHELGQLRSFSTLPDVYTLGIYAMEEYHEKTRSKIVPYFPAMTKFGMRLEEEPHSRRPLPKWSPMYSFMSSCELPYYNDQTQKRELGISCIGCDVALQQHIIKSPPDPWDLTYSREGFLTHFRICIQAQLLWEFRDLHTVEPIEKPEMAKTGDNVEAS